MNNKNVEANQEEGKLLDFMRVNGIEVDEILLAQDAYYRQNVENLRARIIECFADGNDALRRRLELARDVAEQNVFKVDLFRLNMAIRKDI